MHIQIYYTPITPFPNFQRLSPAIPLRISTEGMDYNGINGHDRNSVNSLIFERNDDHLSENQMLMNRLLLCQYINLLDLAAAQRYPQLQCLQYRYPISKVLVSLRLIDLNFDGKELLLLSRAISLNNVLRRIALAFSMEPQIRDERCQVLSASYFKLRCETQLKGVYTNHSAVRLLLRAGCYYWMVMIQRKVDLPAWKANDVHSLSRHVK